VEHPGLYWNDSARPYIAFSGGYCIQAPFVAYGRFMHVTASNAPFVAVQPAGLLKPIGWKLRLFTQRAESALGEYVSNFEQYRRRWGIPLRRPS
jgi:hypothetical protein